jgi:hypothetical protein
MTDVRGSGYDLDALRRRVPDDSAELFLGFIPWSEDCERWTRSVAESLATSSTRSLFRTVWDNPTASGSRVLIDVAECASAVDAMDALVERLATNQLAQLPEGPRDLGATAFTHPDGVPPAAFFVRGNLCISVISFGSRDVAVVPWAARLDRRLGERPKTDRAVVTLQADRSKLKLGEVVAIRYSLPWRLGPEGYFKFFATRGTLTRRENALVLRVTRSGEARVEAFAVEPGREPHTGSVTLLVE